MLSIATYTKFLVEYFKDWREVLDRSPFGGLMAVLMFLMTMMVLGIILAIGEAIIH